MAPGEDKDISSIIKISGNREIPSLVGNGRDRRSYRTPKTIIGEIPLDRKHMTKIKAAIVITFLGLALLTTFTVLSKEVEAYDPHAPILIVGDGAFTMVNGVTGGTGTMGDPYIIDGWEIDASSADGIYIRDTSSHFVIRNVYVHDGTPTNSGIILNNTENGCVENSHVMANWLGVVAFSSANISISDTFAQDNLNTGIGAQDSTNVTLLRNNATSSGGVGFVLTNCSVSTVIGNDAYFNTFSLNIYFSDNITMTFNNLTYGTSGGCWLYSSENISVHHNNFIENNDYQAKDGRGKDNSWDNGYPSGGNHWSDYGGIDANSDGIGDTPYDIIDTTIDDRYPLMAETIIPEFSSMIIPIIGTMAICLIGGCIMRRKRE